MPTTRRPAADTKKRTTRHGNPVEDEVDTKPAPACGDVPAAPNPYANAATVALLVNGDSWLTEPPSIGQIEAALTANGRAQHRVSRIDMGPESAVVHVHPSDVANCIGTIGEGSFQVGRRHPHSARARAVRTHALAITPAAARTLARALARPTASPISRPRSAHSPILGSPSHAFPPPRAGGRARAHRLDASRARTHAC